MGKISRVTVFFQSLICLLFAVAAVSLTCTENFYTLQVSPSVADAANDFFESEALQTSPGVERPSVPEEISLNAKAFSNLALSAGMILDVSNGDAEPTTLSRGDADALMNSVVLFSALSEGNILVNVICFLFVPIAQVGLIFTVLLRTVSLLFSGKLQKENNDLHHRILYIFHGVVGCLPMLAAVGILCGDLTPDSGFQRLIKLCLAAFALLWLLSHCKRYLKGERHFLWITQLLSAAGLAGVCLFVYGWIRSSFVTAIADDFENITGITSLQTFFEGPFNSDAVIFLILIAFVFFAVVGLLGDTTHLLARFSCTVPQKGSKPRSWLHMLILLLSVMLMQYYIQVDLPDEGVIGFWIAIAGAAVMTAAELIMKALEKVAYHDEKEVIHSKSDFTNCENILYASSRKYKKYQAEHPDD